MIKINNKKFAESHKEMIDSLFTDKTTCIGFIKRTKRTIIINNLQNERVGIINQHGVFASASKFKSENKYWYNYKAIKLLGTITQAEEYRVLNQLSIDHDHNGRIFK